MHYLCIMKTLLKWNERKKNSRLRDHSQTDNRNIKKRTEFTNTN